MWHHGLKVFHGYIYIRMYKYLYITRILTHEVDIFIMIYLKFFINWQPNIFVDFYILSVDEMEASWSQYHFVLKVHVPCLNTGMINCKNMQIIQFVLTYTYTYIHTQQNIIPHLMSIFGERTNFLRISKLWTLKQTNIVIILSQCLPIA